MPIPKLSLHEALAESLLHNRHVVLGRELQPFCIDHFLILKSLESPLVYGGAIQIEDLQLAVKACSTPTNMAFYDAALRPGTYWKLWSRVTKAFPVERNIRAFNAYVEDYVPKIQRLYFDFDQGAGESKFPGSIINAAQLVKRGHDEAKVRRMAIGAINSWVLAIAEGDGDPLKHIMSEEECAIRNEIEAEEAGRHV